MNKRFTIGELKKRISEIETYLGPIMSYEDEGLPKISGKFHPGAVWIYEYYLILKNRYYMRLKRDKSKK